MKDKAKVGWWYVTNIFGIIRISEIVKVNNRDDTGALVSSIVTDDGVEHSMPHIAFGRMFETRAEATRWAMQFLNERAEQRFKEFCEAKDRLNEAQENIERFVRTKYNG